MKVTGFLAPSFGVAAVLGIALITGCEREERRFRESPASATAMNVVSQSDLQPGVTTYTPYITSQYEDNAYAVNEGKRLFDQMNCSGCHSHGGGGIGPPLIDDEWIYGSDPQNIFASIVEGRPNGMPSWRGKLGNSEVWELVAYVRALGGFQNKAVRTGRDDHMMVKESEQARYRAQPRKTPPPPGR